MRRKLRQAGVTLVEVLIVILIIGILMYMIASPFRGTGDNANAVAIDATSKSLAKAVGYLHTELGTGLSATGSALPGSGMTMMDVLMVGEDAVASNYRVRYRRAAMRPLEGDFKVIERASGSSSGKYQVASFPVTFVTCAPGKVCVQYDAVPTETVAALAERSGISNFSESTAVTSGAVRYSSANAGFHTVVMERVP